MNNVVRIRPQRAYFMDILDDDQHLVSSIKLEAGNIVDAEREADNIRDTMYPTANTWNVYSVNK